MWQWRRWLRREVDCEISHERSNFIRMWKSLPNIRVLKSRLTVIWNELKRTISVSDKFGLLHLTLTFIECQTCGVQWQWMGMPNSHNFKNFPVNPAFIYCLRQEHPSTNRIIYIPTIATQEVTCNVPSLLWVDIVLFEFSLLSFFPRFLKRVC